MGRNLSKIWLAFWEIRRHQTFILRLTDLYVVTWLSPCEATRRTYASLRCVCTLHTYKRAVLTRARENSKCSCGQQCCSLMHGELWHRSFTSFSDHFFVGVQEKEQKIVYLCIRHAILSQIHSLLQIQRIIFALFPAQLRLKNFAKRISKKCPNFCRLQN